MGVRGPVPKRSEDRIRRNKDESGPVEKIAAIGTVDVPPLGLEDPDPMVIDFYESLKNSAQARYYEASDWWLAKFAAKAIDDYLKNDRGKAKSAMMLQTVLSMLSDLLMTEADRRRLRLEIERNPNGEDSNVLDITDRLMEMMNSQAQ